MSFSSPPLKRPVKRRSLKRCMSSPSCSLRSQNGQDVEPTKVLKGREVWDEPKCLRVGDCEPKQSAIGWRNLRATEVPMGQETCIELCQRERQSCKISLTCATQSRMMNGWGLEVCRKWGWWKHTEFWGFASCSAMHTQQAINKLLVDLLTVNQ